MRTAASTYVFVKDRLHPGMLESLQRAGAQAIEIFAARGHFDYTSRAHVREVAGWFRSSGVEFHSMHAPMHADAEWGRGGSPQLNIADTDRKRQIEAMDEIKRALEVAEQAPFRFLIQHVGTSGLEDDPRRFDAAMTSIEHLRAFARPLGVTLLLENIPNELSTPERLMELLRTAHFDDVGICFDLGHAHIMSDVPSAYETLRERIRSTHVHDNARDRDAHLFPGEGSIAWDEAVYMLRAAPQRPAVLLEIEGEGRADDVLAKMRAAFDDLRRRAERAQLETREEKQAG